MTWAYLGMQLGGVRSTSQVAKSFMGTGLRPDEPIRPAILKLEEMTEAELLEAVEAAERVGPALVTPPGVGRSPPLTALAIT